MITRYLRSFLLRYAVLFLCIIIVLGPAASCTIDHRMQSYYAQRENYLTVTATVDHIRYNEAQTELNLGFADMEYTPNSDVDFDDSCTFLLAGENLRRVQSLGIDQRLQLGEEVTFIAAPEFFYNGYAIPIAGFAMEGETLLEFEEGLENLLLWLDEQ